MLPNSHRTHSTLVAHRMGIDTYQEPVVYMRRDCEVCKSEGFEAQSRVQIRNDGRTIVATLNIVDADLLPDRAAGLSEAAWKLLSVAEGTSVHISHPRPVRSLSHVRAKIHGTELSSEASAEIINDIVAGRYSDVELSSFVTACGLHRMTLAEITALTRAMVDAGDRMDWGHGPIMDKHSIGGLPGNRTTMIVVPIVAANGLTIPKTSSRAITSPAGTADTMECLSPVELSVRDIRRVVELEGGCIVWGGAVRLSPADDILIRIERALDLDSAGQIVASILSKKIAAGSTHIVLDMPIGTTAKVRDADAAHLLETTLHEVARATGLEIAVVHSDGSQPVGRGVGPALEARDVLAVLRQEDTAPQDLRDKSIALAGKVMELAGVVHAGTGTVVAERTLREGKALRKFMDICTAQGGFREPATARHHSITECARSGVVMAIDNRLLARVAKLAGAPHDKAAGLDVHVRLGQRVDLGQPLFTIHAESIGELEYASAFARSGPEIISVATD